jgi:hypothetical protein
MRPGVEPGLFLSGKGRRKKKRSRNQGAGENPYKGITHSTSGEGRRRLEESLKGTVPSNSGKAFRGKNDRCRYFDCLSKRNKKSQKDKTEPRKTKNRNFRKVIRGLLETKSFSEK